MTTKTRPIVAAALLLSVSLLANAAETAPIPVADFFRNPLTPKEIGASPVGSVRPTGEALVATAWGSSSNPIHARKTDVQISPDGRFVSMSMAGPQSSDSPNLRVAKIGELGDAKSISSVQRGNARWHIWSGVDQLLYRIDRGYDKPEYLSLDYIAFFTARADGSDNRIISHQLYRAGPVALAENNFFGPGLAYLDDVPSATASVLINDYEYSLMFPDARRVDLESGRSRTVSRGQMNFTDWFADHRGQVRAAIGRGEIRDDLRYDLYYRESEKADWRAVRTFDQGSLVQVHGFDADNRHLWVSARAGGDRMALYRLDPTSGQLGQPVHEDPVYDVGGSGSRMVSARNGVAMYFQYPTETHAKVFLSEEGRALQAVIDKGLPDTQNDMVSWDDDWRHFIVHAWGDRHPGTYYYFDRETGALRSILQQRPWIDPSQMRPMEPVAFEARDGHKLHAYLTRPSADQDATVPMIVRVHSGPFGIRDLWGFNQEVQFLASRGYAVLQVNYRGSGGYGYAFEKAGFRQWGQAMQDDLSDAVAWAVKQGIADPGNVGIYGAGYGGYAAMMGMASTPDLFRLGIAYSGFYNLPRLHRDLTRVDPVRPGGFTDWAGNWWDQYIGDPKGLRELSPLRLAGNIQAPVMMIHGQFDPVSDMNKQFWPMVGALKKAGAPLEVFERRFEGHGFVKEIHNIELYSAMETFLARHMPAQRGPIAEATAADE